MEQCNTADACVATALHPPAHGCSVDATKAVTDRIYKPHMLFMCPSCVFLHVHATLHASACVHSRVMLDEEHDTLTLPFWTRCVLVQILLCSQVSTFVFLLSSWSTQSQIYEGFHSTQLVVGTACVGLLIVRLVRWLWKPHAVWIHNVVR